AFTLDAFGVNFFSSSTIVFNGTRYQPVTLINPQHISIQIPAGAISANACPQTPCLFNVLVSNPDPINVGSFINSTPLPFTVVAPAITISPNPVATVSVGNQVSLTVAVNQAPASQIVINVDTGDHNIAMVTTTATIPANQTTATVTLTGIAVGQTGVTASLTGYT